MTPLGGAQTVGLVAIPVIVTVIAVNVNDKTFDIQPVVEETAYTFV
jgi:hypothetical protein